MDFKNWNRLKSTNIFLKNLRVHIFLRLSVYISKYHIQEVYVCNTDKILIYTPACAHTHTYFYICMIMIQWNIGVGKIYENY